MDQAIDGCLYIRGGSLYVDAGGDGLDSNGSIEISGGEIYVSGSSGGGDAPLDYNGTCIITGGTFMQTGNSGMAEYESEDSTQKFAALTLSSTLAAGTEIEVQDGSGSSLYKCAMAKSGNFLAYTAPGITDGSEIYFVIDGEKQQGTIK